MNNISLNPDEIRSKYQDPFLQIDIRDYLKDVNAMLRFILQKNRYS